MDLAASRRGHHAVPQRGRPVRRRPASRDRHNRGRRGARGRGGRRRGPFRRHRRHLGTDRQRAHGGRLRHLLPPPLLDRPCARASAWRRAALGAVGTTGSRSATEPHLHFGVREAGSEHAYRNPLDFLPPPPPHPANRRTQLRRPPLSRCPRPGAPGRPRAGRAESPSRPARAGSPGERRLRGGDRFLAERPRRGALPFPAGPPCWARRRCRGRARRGLPTPRTRPAARPAPSPAGHGGGAGQPRPSSESRPGASGLWGASGLRRVRPTPPPRARRQSRLPRRPWRRTAPSAVTWRLRRRAGPRPRHADRLRRAVVGGSARRRYGRRTKRGEIRRRPGRPPPAADPRPRLITVAASRAT